MEDNWPVSVSQNNTDDMSICNIVRKWNLTYDEEKDVILFIERLSKLKDAYSEMLCIKIWRSEQLLHALPKLLKYSKVSQLTDLGFLG